MSASLLERPLVIAHRGAKAYRPENTFEAFELAVEQGADMIETDLHRTRDGAIPLAHDAGLEERGREAEISELDWQELQSLPGAAIPLLGEVLDRFASRIPFNLEIKTRVEDDPYPALEAEALAEVEGRGLLSATLFSSFSDPVLAELRRQAPVARLAALVDPRRPGRAIERALDVAAEAVNPHFSLVTNEFVRSAHDAGLAVFVYTVDAPDQMRDLLDKGVDGIFSNCPDRLRGVVDSLHRAR